MGSTHLRCLGVQRWRDYSALVGGVLMTGPTGMCSLREGNKADSQSSTKVGEKQRKSVAEKL